MKKIFNIVIIVFITLIVTCPNAKDLAESFTEVTNAKGKMIANGDTYPFLEYNFFVCKTFRNRNTRYLGIFGNFFLISESVGFT